MQLKARAKTHVATRVTRRQRAAPAPPTQPEPRPYLLAIRCNAMLYNTMQNMLMTAHTAQDFTFSSVADVIRAALQSYRDGMALTELEEPGEKVSTTIRVDRPTKDFYASLPDRLRTKILERAIRTFLQRLR